MTDTTKVKEDEPFGGLTINGYGIYNENDQKRLQALIDKYTREARIDELDMVASPINRASVHPNAGFDYYIGWGISEDYLRNRIHELKQKDGE